MLPPGIFPNGPLRRFDPARQEILRTLTYKGTLFKQTARLIAIVPLRLYNIHVKAEETRIKILKILHSFYKDKPLNFLKTEVLVNQIGEGEREVLSNLDYLLDGGYIEGKKFKTFSLFIKPVNIFVSFYITT